MVFSFGDICILLEGVEKVSTRRPRYAPGKEQQYIQQHIRRWFNDHRRALDDPETPGAAILSAIFPHRRKDRVYGLKPRLLSKKIGKLLNFSNLQRAVFNGWTTGVHGDLGRYTELAFKPWDGTFKTKRIIPIERVDNLLVQLAAKYRFSDPSIQQQRDWHMSTDAELQYVLNRLESWEAKWFVRLLLREYTTISLDEAYIFQQYHFLLPYLLKFQNDFDAALSMLRGELSCYPSAPETLQEKVLRVEAGRLLKAVVGIKVARPDFAKAWSFKHCIQLVGRRVWAAEVKYDGEYCEIHIDLESASNDIKIFSKNGKDATVDREPLHGIICNALRIGQPGCIFKRNCILLAEMVLYSDRERKILSFSKIRKHIKRSGSFLGTLQDSLPHEWEHLMLVFFDVLVLDDEPIMRDCLQKRRKVLRDLVHNIPGRSQRSEWTLLNFKSEDGITDVKQAFARSLANRQEGLILKPLGVPYFPLLSGVDHYQSGYFIKLKKDYLGDMDGQRDLGDFAIVGACFDPQVAPKTDLKLLHWTHFHIGCVTNKSAVQRLFARPKFKVVGCLSLDRCIPKSELKHLNEFGQFQKVDLDLNHAIDDFEIDHGKNYDRRMTVAFRKPFVAEILGSGYEKVQNEAFEMLRHPRIKKIHHDRTWEDAVTMDELERMAEEKWDIPGVDELNGHARDVAILVKRYRLTVSECETTQETTQRTSQPIIVGSATPSDAIVQETQQTVTNTCTTITTSQCSGSTQGNGSRASREVRSILVREDTSERVDPAYLTPSNTSLASSAKQKGSPAADIVSPPPSKRRRIRNPLEDARGNRILGAFDYDSQDKVIHIYADEGLRVQVHAGPQAKE